MPLEHLALSRATLDRASHLRGDPELVRKLWSDPATRVVPVAASQALVQSAGDGGAQLAVDSGEGWAQLWAGQGQLDLREAAFLGLDEHGVPYLAIPVPEGLPAPEDTRWAGLREVGSALDDTGAGVLVAAVAVLAWHVAHRRCSRCGQETDVTLGGWQRTCPNCGAEHYPRTDPAVIMAIVDAQDRILLGRQSAWPEHRFSTLAGFVEPGEPLEAAVRREVAEESGVVVGEVTYRGSQPWPFPSSLMVGFRGEALTTEITVDGVELAQARWLSRDELIADISSGEVRLPPPLSIARRLIEDWYGGPLPH
jgi:NAD+ diphosphatase